MDGERKVEDGELAEDAREETFKIVNLTEDEIDENQGEKTPQIHLSNDTYLTTRTCQLDGLCNEEYREE